MNWLQQVFHLKALCNMPNSILSDGLDIVEKTNETKKGHESTIMILT